MQPTSGELPKTAWKLTAPETFVLKHGPDASGVETFKMAVLDLVARGALRVVEVEEPRAFGRTRRTSVLAPGAKPAPPEAQPLASVWLLYSGIPLKTFADGTAGVEVAEFARAARRRYTSLDRYRFEEVVSALIDRRLLVRAEYRVLWLFSRQRIVITPAGERAQADLEQRLALGEREFAGWVSRDPARAFAFAGLAGASVLLMTPLFPEFQRLRQALGPDPALGATAGSYGSDYSGTGEPLVGPGEGGPGFNIDLGGLSLPEIDLGSLSFDFDLSAFDSIGDAMNAIDSGVDSGGGGGGDSSSSGGESGGDSGGGGGDGGGGGSE